MTTGFYRQFEESHRGSEDTITEKLSVYAPALELLEELLPGSAAVDLGCGRGEWLKLVGQYGLKARGIDTDSNMLAACKQKGLDVVNTDAVAFLRSAEDNSLGLVSAFHLVEHIPFDALNELLQQAHRALKPGGLLILETPNPENPLIGSCYFYMDPTHIKPLPPALLKFATEFSGFETTTVWRLNEADNLRHQAPSLYTVMRDASPDYAILAQKPGHEGAENAFLPLAKESKGITLEELATRFDNHHRETTDRLTKETTHLGHQLTASLEGLLERQNQQTKRDEEHRLLTAEHQKLMAHHAQLLQDYRHLLDSHEQKLRALSVLTRILQPLHYRYVRERERFRQLRHSARTRLFYQWQLIKLMRLFGMTHQASRMAKRIGLTASGDSHSGFGGSDATPTGPMPGSLKPATIRSITHELSDRTASPSDRDLAICIEGHFSGSYSLAAVNRHLAVALLETGHTKLCLLPREGERTDAIHDAPSQQLSRLQPLVSASGCEGDVAIYHHFPVVENPDPAQGLPVLVFFWEESRVPPETIEQINQNYRGVLVMSWLVRKALIDSGCYRPIALVPLPLDDGRAQPLPAKTDAPLRFLHVSSCFPRKGADVLLDAFATLLERYKDLELVIKTFPNPHNDTEAQLAERVPAALQSRITLIQEDYDDNAMESLYQEASAMVLPTRGEGLNLPAIEAIRHGLPVVTTGYGAHTDFLTGDGARLVNYRFALSGSHLKTPGSLWVNPDVNDLIAQCETVIEQLRNNQLPEAMVDTQARITEQFFSDSARHRLRDGLQRLLDFDAPAEAPNPSVTLVSTWGEACGIAEYSRYLAQTLMAQGTPVSVLAPSHLLAPGEAPLADQLQSLRPAWEQQGALRLAELSQAPEALWLQYHPGFFPLDESVSRAIAEATRQGRARFITLHATLPLLDLPEERRRQTADTLNQFYRVIVHTPSDMNNLKQLGVIDNLALLPQGVARVTKTREESSDARPFTVGGFGFLFPHKGILELIDAFAAFVKQTPDAKDARLLLLNSEHPSPGSGHYRQLCQQRLQKHGLEDRTEFCTEFLEEADMTQRLAGCDLLILPYRETPESSSAAVRTAVASCDTVAVTPARIFSEVRQATLTLPGFDSHDITQLIQATWRGDNADQLKEVHQARANWLAEHDWHRVAGRHRALLQASDTDCRWLTGLGNVTASNSTEIEDTGA